jgi:hypothetical protein
MKFAGPAVMTIVLMTAKSVDDDIGIARSKAQGRLRAGLFTTEREAPFRRQALDQEFHGGRWILANAFRKAKDARPVRLGCFRHTGSPALGVHATAKSR